MDIEVQTVTAYKCPVCYEKYDKYNRAVGCVFNHAKEQYANSLLEDGRSLDSINYLCGFGWELSDNQKTITKDSCFVISYLQCCDEPAYKIISIDCNGKIKVGGSGSWSGYYTSTVRLDNLKDPQPKDKLFIHKRG